MTASIYFQPEHHQFREQVRHFFEKSIDAEAWEAAEKLPASIWRQMGELGFLGISNEEKYGGSEADFFYAAVFLEEVGYTGLGGFAAAVGVQEFMACAHIEKFGSEALKQKYLVPSIAGEKIGALGISEPDVGSDVANLRTRARREGDEFVIDGAKTFITNGAHGDFVTVAARTGEAGSGGISLIVVDQGTAGFSASTLTKMGWHCSDTAELRFDQVRVPVSNLIGEEGKGFYYIMEAFQLERLVAALQAIGGAERAISETLSYIKEREAFGRPIARYQVLRHRLTDLMTELEAAKLLTYHACWLYDQGKTDVSACTMAKLKTSELGKTVADTCLQCFGGYGFMEEYTISRLYRDARAGTIVGGTTEIMHEILGKILIDGVRFNSPAPPKKKEVAEDHNPSIPELFASLPSRFKGDAMLRARVHFDFKEDDAGEFTVMMKDSVCSVSPGLTGEADCTVTTSGQVYRDIELGTLGPEAAFMQGKIQVSNLPAMMQFLQAFRSVKKNETRHETLKKSHQTEPKTQHQLEEESPDPSTENAPLQGLRVLDLTRLYPGPFAAMILADLGAETIKIELPDKPDPMRSYPPYVAGQSAGYCAVNGNKSSIALNWQSDEGRNVLANLIQEADIVLEGYRPGVMDQLGVGYKWMSEQNPRVILVSISGYGQTGPYANRAGHDINYVGFTGMLSPTIDGAPPLPIAQIADTAGGAYATVIAALSAVQARHQIGRGQHVDLSMMEASLPLMTLQLAHAWASEKDDSAMNQPLLSGALACYRTYRCGDDHWIALGALEPKFWKTFCEVLERPQWLDRHLVTGSEKDALVAEISARLRTQPRQHWLDLFHGKHACLSPIHSLKDVANDPHLLQRGMITTTKDGNMIGTPWRFSDTPTAGQRTPAPELGANTDKILGEIAGFDQERIAKLRDSGMIR